MRDARVKYRHRKQQPSSASSARLSTAIAAILASAPLHAPAAETTGEIDEIQVTATRRSESISDVPYNISAVSGADIAAAGITDLQALTHLIPGLVSPDLGARASSINSNLTIRGLNASAVKAETQQIAAPLVSTYVDETPLFANLKMTDIERVEVLRGPQGTLYGSGSVGGTVRLIHNEPDFKSTQFDVSTRASHTENATNPSEAVDFIGNLPIGETLAFRGSGGYERLAGFTDALSVAVLGPNAQPVLADPANPLTSPPVFAEQRGVDWSDTWYTRGALLWKPNEAFRLTLSYQHQTDQSGGYSQASPGARYIADCSTWISPAAFRPIWARSTPPTIRVRIAVVRPRSYTSQSTLGQYDITGLIESLSSIYDGISAHPLAHPRPLIRQGRDRGIAPRVQGSGTLGLGLRRLLQPSHPDPESGRAHLGSRRLE